MSHTTNPSASPRKSPDQGTALLAEDHPNDRSPSIAWRRNCFRIDTLCGQVAANFFRMPYTAHHSSMGQRILHIRKEGMHNDFMNQMASDEKKATCVD